jgi:hypothetical protein
LLDGIALERLIGDQGYGTDAIRAWCAERGTEVVIPPKRNRKVVIPHPCERYPTQHRTENLFCRVKDWTRSNLCKDKTSRSPAGFVTLPFALINIQCCPWSLGQQAPMAQPVRLCVFEPSSEGRRRRPADWPPAIGWT